MEIYDVVKKLLGEIDPVGDSCLDGIRLANLKATTDLVNKLLFDISHVARCKDNDQHSMKLAGTRADNFLKEIAESYEDSAVQLTTSASTPLKTDGHKCAYCGSKNLEYAMVRCSDCNRDSLVS